MWLWISGKEMRAWLDVLRPLAESARQREETRGEAEKTAAAPAASRQTAQAGKAKSAGGEGAQQAAPAAGEAAAPEPGGSAAAFRQSLAPYVRRSVELSTDGGSIAGTVDELGPRYAVIREPGDRLVVVNLEHLIYVEVTGDE